MPVVCASDVALHLFRENGVTFVMFPLSGVPWLLPASGTALVWFRESSVALTLCYVSFEWCSVVVFPASGTMPWFWFLQMELP